MNPTYKAAFEALSSFVILKRATTDETFVAKKTDAPEWVRDAVKECHNIGGDLWMPNDWLYSASRDVAATVANGSLHDAKYLGDWAQERAHEIADGLVDIARAVLHDWAAENGCIAAEGEALAKETGFEFEDVEQALRVSQYCILERVASIWLQAIADRALELEVEQEEVQQ